MDSDHDGRTIDAKAHGDNPDRADAAIAQLVEWLAKASENIAEDYMLLPVAGAARQYRERVYCYELYHQLRSLWGENFGFSLCGEIDKRGHAFVKGEDLDNIKPDFLIHDAGRMDETSNLLVIEVKPASAIKEEMRKDLRKLSALRRALVDEHGRAANYHQAFFFDLRSVDVLLANGACCYSGER